MASVQSPPPPGDALSTPADTKAVTASTERPKVASPPESTTHFPPEHPTKDPSTPKKPSTPSKPLVYTWRHLLTLSASPLVQRPEGMPPLKDWFGDWPEQHSSTQTKKDTAEPNGTTGSRSRFPRRDLEDGESSSRPSFRSTLSQPSQMGNFKHQPLRGDLTRSGDRDKDTDRDKEGLRSLSDMYDRDRLALPLTLPSIIRPQQRDSISHLPGSSITATSGRLGGREPRAERESTRRGENVRRKGGESVDWRRGTESSRGGKEETKRGERERSTEPDRRRRDRSASREKLNESRRELRAREREREIDEKDVDKSRRREDGHSDRREKLSERIRDSDDRRKVREEGDKEDRRKEREKAREHPDTRRDREPREGMTIGEERASSRRTGGRRGEEDSRREREREKEKEPAWMDDYVPEPGAPKAGIFGGKIEGVDDEIQAWKKQQAVKGANEANNGAQNTEPIIDAVQHDSTTVNSGTQPSQSTPSDEQAKAADAFFLGLMKSESSKSLSHTTTPAKSPELTHTVAISSAKSSTHDVALKSSSPATGLTKVDPAVISAAALGLSKLDVSPNSLNGIRDTTQTVSTSLLRTSPGPLSSTSSALSSSHSGQLGSNALLADTASSKPLATPVSAQFNPTQQSRVLAFSQSSGSGNRIPPAGVIGQPAPLNRAQPSPLGGEVLGGRGNIQMTADNVQPRSAFSPFDATSSSFSPDNVPPGVNHHQPSAEGRGAGDGILDERNPRLSPQALLSGANYDGNGGSASTYAAAKGSRFAKFWDGKTKEATPQPFQSAPGPSRIQPPPPPQSVSPSVPQQVRQPELNPANGLPGNISNADNIQDMLAFLQNPQPASRLAAPQSGLHRQHPSHLQALHEPQMSHHQPQPQHHFSNPSSLLDNPQQFENRPFVPDGLVPGLRPARIRGDSLYNDSLDDPAFTVQQRLPPIQQPPPPTFERTQIPQQLYNNQAPSGGLGGGLSGIGTNRGLQPQLPFRVDPNAMNGPGPLQQRLPPGLANLGGRPPHDPNGYVNLGGVGALGGLGMGMQGPGVMGHQQQQQQQPFNQFGGGNAGAAGGFGLGGIGLPGGTQHQQQPQPQLQRGPIPMQLNVLGTSGHPEFTVQPHPLLRGPPPRGGMQVGGFGGVHGAGPIPQGPMGLRQQQQGQGMPHLLPQMLPPHIQQQQQQQQHQAMSLPGGGQPQPQNEHLLSMLMGGLNGPRE